MQVNYADQDVTFLGKQEGLYHQYVLYYSLDGKKWKVLTDKRNNKKDVPHDYIELSQPVRARFVKLENVRMPGGKFAISGLRVFGKGEGSPPAPVRDLVVLRTEKDKRSAWLKWRPTADAYACNIYYGTAPDRLYTCVMVHSTNEYYLKTMDRQSNYYFSIEAVNENGVSARTKPAKVE